MASHAPRGYELRWRKASNFRGFADSDKKALLATDTSHKITGLDPGTDYIVVIVTLDSSKAEVSDTVVDRRVATLGAPTLSYPTLPTTLRAGVEFATLTPTTRQLRNGLDLHLCGDDRRPAVGAGVRHQHRCHLRYAGQTEGYPHIGDGDSDRHDGHGDEHADRDGDGDAGLPAHLPLQAGDTDGDADCGRHLAAGGMACQYRFGGIERVAVEGIVSHGLERDGRDHGDEYSHYSRRADGHGHHWPDDRHGVRGVVVRDKAVAGDSTYVDSDWSSAASATPKGIPAPTGLVVEDEDDTALTLRWTPPEDTRFHGLTRSIRTRAAGSHSMPAWISTDVRITGLTNGQSYSFRLRAVRAVDRRNLQDEVVEDAGCGKDSGGGNAFREWNAGDEAARARDVDGGVGRWWSGGSDLEGTLVRRDTDGV